MAKEREQRQRATRLAVQREERRERHDARRRLRRWLYLGASGVIAILITISLFLPSVTKNRTSKTAEGGPGETFAILPATHIADNVAYDQYNSVPPTSGPHWASPAPWGVQAAPLPNERQVHNLEHGGIMVQYKSSDQALIKQLEEFAKKQPNYPCYLIVAPYPAMDFTIAVTAWGVRDTMQAFDEAKLQAFLDAYRNRGPEKVPCTP